MWNKRKFFIITLSGFFVIGWVSSYLQQLFPNLIVLFFGAHFLLLLIALSLMLWSELWIDKNEFNPRKDTYFITSFACFIIGCILLTSWTLLETSAESDMSIFLWRKWGIEETEIYNLGWWKTLEGVNLSNFGHYFSGFLLIYLSSFVFYLRQSRVVFGAIYIFLVNSWAFTVCIE